MLKIVILLFLEIFLYADNKIVLATFSKMENANCALKEYQETQSYKELSILAKDNNFTVHTRKSKNDYFVVVVEKIKDTNTSLKALDILKSEFKGLYFVKIKPEKELAKQKHINKIIKKYDKPIVVKPIEKNTTKVKVVEVKKPDLKEVTTNIVQKSVKTKSDDISIVLILEYFALFIFLSVLVYYF